MDFVWIFLMVASLFFVLISTIYYKCKDKMMEASVTEMEEAEQRRQREIDEMVEANQRVWRKLSLEQTSEIRHFRYCFPETGTVSREEQLKSSDPPGTSSRTVQGIFRAGESGIQSIFWGRCGI